MAAVDCFAPGCDGLLPPYAGTGRRRRWCSSRCRRKAEGLAGSYRSGTLGVLADEWRSLGYSEHGAQLDAWRELFDGFEKARR